MEALFGRAKDKVRIPLKQMQLTDYQQVALQVTQKGDF